MRLFRFDSGVGRPITAFGSANVAIAGIVRVFPDGDEPVQIGCMHFDLGGVVGAHPAVGPQLFLVVSGEGWVRGALGEGLAPRQPIVAGQAAFWESGELHESGSDGGMTAIVVEGSHLDPARFMPEVGTYPPGTPPPGATWSHLDR